jgi:hypothetical protein
MKISNHAIMRIRQRLNLRHDDMWKIAKKAYTHGACGRHLPELANSVLKWPKSEFKVLDENVFVFIGITLITAYPLRFYERKAA